MNALRNLFVYFVEFLITQSNAALFGFSAIIYNFRAFFSFASKISCLISIFNKQQICSMFIPMFVIVYLKKMNLIILRNFQIGKFHTVDFYNVLLAFVNCVERILFIYILTYIGWKIWWCICLSLDFRT